MLYLHLWGYGGIGSVNDFQEHESSGVLALKMSQGIPNKHMILRMRTFVTNRNFKHFDAKDSSNTYTIKDGVPQGSVHVPFRKQHKQNTHGIIFNFIQIIECNDIIPNEIRYTSMYADDIAIYADDNALMESGLKFNKH